MVVVMPITFDPAALPAAILTGIFDYTLWEAIQGLRNL